MTDQEDPEQTIPIAYFLTFTCYGTHLHGDEKGSVNSDQNEYDTPFIPPDTHLKRLSRHAMKQDHYEMDRERRGLMLNTVREVCDHRNWLLIAVHVRSDHVHVVIHAPRKPKRVLEDLKSYASRRLSEHGFDCSDRRRWTRGGSRQFLFRIDSLQSAIRYTLHDQGKPMARYLHNALETEQFEEYDAALNRKLRTFLQEEHVIDERGNVIGAD